MNYIYLVAIVFSGWDGHIVSQKIMARFNTMKECQVAASQFGPNTDVLCLPDAREFDERNPRTEGDV